MIFRYLNYLMILLFALSAVAQYNDPDSVDWIAIYAAASLLSLFYAIGKLHWIAGAIIAGIAAIWAITIIPDLSTSGFRYIFDELQMRATGVEDAREFSGLLIVSAWTGILAFLSFRKKPDEKSLK